VTRAHKPPGTADGVGVTMLGLDPAAPPDDRAPTAAERAEPTPGTARLPLWKVAGPGVVVGLVSALWGLSRSALWLDEAYSLGAMHQLGRTLQDTSATMGAYYLVLRAWTEVSESVWWMRSLSVLCAVGAVVVATRLATRLVGDERARLAGVLAPLSFLWLTYAREARSYALVMVLAAVAWLALDHGLADADPRTRRRWWLAHTALTVVLPLAHGLALLQVLPQALVLLAAGADRATWIRFARGVGAGLAATAGLLTIGANQVGDWVAPLSADQLANAVRLYTSPFAALAVVLVGVVAVGVAVHVGAARRAAAPLDRARALLPLAWALGPLLLLIALSVVRPSLVPRYVVASIPALALLTASGLDAIGTRLPSLRRPAVAVVIALLVVGHVDTHRAPADGWTAAAEVVAAGAEPGDTILFAGAEARPPFEAEWREVDAATTPEAAPGARPLGEVLRFEPDERRDATRWRAAATADVIWLVGDTARDDVDGAVELLTAAPGGSHEVVRRSGAADSSIVVVVLAPTRPD
jgi:mannosyltransferase